MNDFTQDRQTVVAILGMMCAGLLLATQPANVFAQNSAESGRDEVDQIEFVPVMAFELQIEAMSHAAFIKNLANSFKNSSPFDLSAFNPQVIRGVVSIPKQYEELTQRWGSLSSEGPFNDRPAFHFFIEIAVRGSDQYRDFLELVERQPGQEINGIKHLALLPDQPRSLMVVAEKERLLLFTEKFTYIPEGRPQATDRAERSFREAPKEDLVVAVDLESLRSMTRTAIEEVEGTLPTYAWEDLERLEYVDAITLLLTAREKLQLGVDILCRSEKDARELIPVIKQWLELVGPAPELPQPFGGTAAGAELMKSLTIRDSGKWIEIRASLGEALLAGVQESQKDVLVANNQRQALIATHNYHDAFEMFPFQGAPNQHESLSWRVSILPFIGQRELYDRLDLSVPWDSPHNKAVLERIPEIFGENGMTNICWVKSDVRSIYDIGRGSSNTICFISSSKYVPWTQNNDLNHFEALAEFMKLQPGESLTVTMYDGSVRRIPAEMDVKEFEKMLLPNEDD